MPWLAFAALAVSMLSFVVSGWQTRLLRKTLESSNYQALLDKVLDSRDNIIEHGHLGAMFEQNPQIKATLDHLDISISEFFWVLKFFTTWENFFQQRRMGLLADATWLSYKNSMTLIFSTPKLNAFWGDFSKHANYRSDWAEFVSSICSGVEPKDPILPKWRRMIGYRS